jgi:integrase
VVLEHSEQVRNFIASKQCSNGFKQSLVDAYALYCQHRGIRWNKPFYERYDKQPKIPSEQKLDVLIANASSRMPLILSMMKDLATRPIELTWLKVKDIDLETGVVNITTAKFGIGRTLKLKPQTLAMLKTYVNKKKLGLNDRLFAVKSSSISEHYRILRNRLANKLQNTSLKTIRLYDFRHFRASMTYHQTKDLLFTQKFLGHRDLRSTLRYIQLVDFGSDEFHSAVAKTLQEACQMIEQGFDYVTEMDGVKIFRKRK